MPFPAYLYATPSCVAASNAPNLIDRIVFQGRAAGTVNCRGTIPTFDKQVIAATCKASAVAALVDMPVLRANAKGVCSFMQTFLIMPPGGALRATMKNNVLVVTAAGNGMAWIGDIYVDRIEWNNPLTNDDVYAVLDADNVLVAQGHANLQNLGQVVVVNVGRYVKGGLQVPNLLSGTLAIYLGKPRRN